MKKQAEQLISSAKAAQKQFGAFTSDMEERKASIKKLCTSFKLQALSGNENLSVEMKAFIGQMTTSVDAVLQKLQKDLDAQEFIQQFDTSLIVLVVGKVNVGKSSLGNLVSGDVFNKALGADSPFKDVRREFRIHQHANQGKQSKSEVLTSQHFQEKETECTASIQEFTLDGLTWVDTPGLHSMTQANQDLAKQYIDSAELVIYLTNSDSPLTHKDAEELRLLGLEQNKRLIIVISRCDTSQDDFDENDEVITKIIPKSSEDKQAQQEWVQRNLKEFKLGGALEKSRAYPISTVCAKEALATNNETLWIDSGAKDFYEVLIDTVSMRAVELKQQAPKDRLNALIQQITQPPLAQADDREAKRCVTNLYTMEEVIAQTLAKVRHCKQSVEVKQSGVKRRLIQRAKQVTTEKMQGLQVGSNSHQLEVTLSSEIDKVARIIFDEEYTPILTDVLKDCSDGLSSIQAMSISVGDVQNKTETIQYSPDEVFKKSTGKGLGSVVGSAIGFVFGGPVGGFIGGVAGNWLGGMAGEAMKNMETDTIIVGDNRDEVKAAVMNSIEPKVNQLVEDGVRHINESLLNPIEAQWSSVQKELNRIQTEISKLSY